MDVNTTRFGQLHVADNDRIVFPQGMIGLEEYREWVLLGDAVNDNVAWLQCLTDGSLAVAVVSPRRFAPDYRIRIGAEQLETLQLGPADRVFVLSLVSKNDNCMTTNLKAPVIINLDRRLGGQVITNDEQPLQLELSSLPVNFRKSA